MSIRHPNKELLDGEAQGSPAAKQQTNLPLILQMGKLNPSQLDYVTHPTMSLCDSLNDIIM